MDSPQSLILYVTWMSNDFMDFHGQNMSKTMVFSSFLEIDVPLKSMVQVLPVTWGDVGAIYRYSLAL